MTHHFTVSDLGFRLIKAYEGYRAESRMLISGGSVVGYGHRVADQDVIALTREEADSLLREDIQPVEELVNEAIFAPLTQGQFDALCSLAYNIGETAFLASNVVKAINNGRPIDAANGFDVWRKGEIDGQTFIVDALVRRRTAEKALFLKPERRPVTSPRDSLPPVPDDVLSMEGQTSMPVYTVDDAEGFVGKLPYGERPNPGRRREDGPAGILELSEFAGQNTTDLPADIGFVPSTSLNLDDGLDETVQTEYNTSLEKSVAEDDADAPLSLSPIAEAAAEVSNRLDALIDDYDAKTPDISDMPDTLLDASAAKRKSTNAKSVVVQFPGKELDDSTSDEVVQVEEDLNKNANIAPLKNKLEEDEKDSASRFIERYDSDETQPSSIFAFGIMMVSGLIMFGLSLYAWLKDPSLIFGQWGPVVTLSGMIMGGVIILGSIYYIMKAALNRR